MTTGVAELAGRAVTDLMERGWVPDAIIRRGIRRLCAERLAGEAALDRRSAFLAEMRQGPIAPVPEKANEQHYELPPEFMERVLGPALKYSCGFWGPSCRGLADAEAAALMMTAERALLADGQRVLELGCGWGALSLFMARRFPRSSIVAVSNSAPQRRFIEAEAGRLGVSNLEVRTADMNVFAPGAQFDRVISVEMFEHMRNWRSLTERIRAWLAPDGLLLVHVFAHRTFAYPFDAEGSDNWLGRHFFTGGLMPTPEAFDRVIDALAVDERWWWNGTHYARTAEAWLRNLDAARAEVLLILGNVYGAAHASRWLRRWRVFFMACAELFGYAGGTEWGVTHVRMRPRGPVEVHR